MTNGCNSQLIGGVTIDDLCFYHHFFTIFVETFCFRIFLLYARDPGPIFFFARWGGG